MSLLFLQLVSCTDAKDLLDRNVLNENSKNIFVTSHSSFGPPQISSRLIGDYRWQWSDLDNHKPISLSINVVVYRNVSIQEVKRAFPVDPSKKQDYRYVSYSEASTFFDLELEKIEKEIQSYDSPCDIGEMYIYPHGLYRTALAMERKFSQD